MTYTEVWRREDGRAFVLTHREQQVLKMIADGNSNREIGCRLGITERTVKAHVSKVLLKLQVNSRLQAGLNAHRYLPTMPTMPMQAPTKPPGTSTNGQ